jgi:SAM-dependent methyltransferase
LSTVRANDAAPSSPRSISVPIVRHSVGGWSERHNRGAFEIGAGGGEPFDLVVERVEAAGVSMLFGRGATTRLAIQLARLTATDRVVDIGREPGSAARAAAGNGADVVGVDPAPVVLTLARRATRRTGTVTWKHGTAESLPLTDGWATVAWSIATVHHWRDIDRGLAEAHRLLAPDGRLVVIERLVQSGHRSRQPRLEPTQADRFAELCAQAGFVDAHVTNHGNGRRAGLAVTATAANPAPVRTNQLVPAHQRHG